VYYDRHDYDKAKTELEALLKKNPSYYDAMLLLGDVYFNQGNRVQALHWYEQGYDNGQRTAGLLTQLGDLYVESGKTQNAIARYEESLHYDTTNVKVYQRLGELVLGKEGNEYRRIAATRR
jgi:tetratricopeptide (TPR) repeat protein